MYFFFFYPRYILAFSVQKMIECPKVKKGVYYKDPQSFPFGPKENYRTFFDLLNSKKDYKKDLYLLCKYETLYQ